MKIGNRWISLNALHSFEAAARHGHMGNAATELNVTQSAVSHQVKALETELGISLFERQGRRIVITPPGLRLMKAIQEGFDGISAAALSLQDQTFDGDLTIMSPVSLSVEWLTERLATFVKKFPNLNLRCRIADRGLTTIPAEIDVAIVFDSFSFQGRVVSPLLQIDAFPVCAPGLVDGPGPHDPELMKRYTLIHEDGGHLWARWFAGMGIEQFTPQRHIYAGSLHDALTYAREGVGFALTDWLISGKDVRSGSLLQPFGPQSLKLNHYYLVTRAQSSSSNATDEFCRWLRREMAANAIG